ncbi:hypothetical protein [Actinomadura hibisca]|uniref:hypothetical protein n=1 Tax=Actinomadura hibisca TaxID=68565 RepID=UPI00082DBAEE|nr:hypothetical protein [Actinomadura hibisca]
MAELRYQETSILLRVFSPEVPIVGESIFVVHDIAGWGYQASTGEWLAYCSERELAAANIAERFVCFGLWPSPNGKQP